MVGRPVEYADGTGGRGWLTGVTGQKMGESDSNDWKLETGNNSSLSVFAFHGGASRSSPSSIYRYSCFFFVVLSHRETAYLQNLRLIAGPFTIQSSPPFIVGHSRSPAYAYKRSGNSFELQLCGIAYKQSIRTAMYGTSTSIYVLLSLHMICISLVDLLHVSLLY